jgi:hypothetical protein
MVPNELPVGTDAGERVAPPERGAFEFWTVALNSIALQPARLIVREYGGAYPGVDNNEAGFVRLGMDSPEVNHSATHR